MCRRQRIELVGVEIRIECPLPLPRERRWVTEKAIETGETSSNAGVVGVAFEAAFSQLDAGPPLVLRPTALPRLSEEHT